MNKKADKILSTTINLFIRDGVKKITMDDIAKNAKVSKVTIYKYFEDKDSLYLKISRHIFTYYIECLKSTVVSGEDLVKRLYEVLSIISDFTNNGRFKLCRELASYNPVIKAEYELYLHTYRQAIMTFIDEGIECGFIKNNLDRDMIFYFIDMGVDYYQRNDAYRNKMVSDSVFREKFMLFIISNIFVDKAQILSVK